MALEKKILRKDNFNEEQSQYIREGTGGTSLISLTLLRSLMNYDMFLSGFSTFPSLQKEKIARLERSLQCLNEQISFAQAECVEKDAILAKQAKVAEEAILGKTPFTFR